MKLFAPLALCVLTLSAVQAKVFVTTRDLNAKAVLQAHFGEEAVYGFNVDSMVDHQPMGREEIWRGAASRLDRLKNTDSVKNAIATLTGPQHAGQMTEPVRLVALEHGIVFPQNWCDNDLEWLWTMDEHDQQSMRDLPYDIAVVMMLTYEMQAGKIVKSEEAYWTAHHAIPDKLGAFGVLQQVIDAKERPRRRPSAASGSSVASAPKRGRHNRGKAFGTLIETQYGWQPYSWHVHLVQKSYQEQLETAVRSLNI